MLKSKKFGHVLLSTTLLMSLIVPTVSAEASQPQTVAPKVARNSFKKCKIGSMKINFSS